MGLKNDKLVKVDCDTKSSHGEKSYALLDGTFTATVTDDGDGNFRCVITITQDGAKEYVKQYGKTHSLKELKDAAITLKYVDKVWVVDGQGHKNRESWTSQECEVQLFVIISKKLDKPVKMRGLFAICG